MNTQQKRTGKKPIAVKVVPWYNKQEYYQVYKSLYSDCPLERRWAVDRIWVWETRCHPALPVGAEVTASLVRAGIQDTLACNGSYVLSSKDVSLMYSTGLVRFCNMVCELKQTREFNIPLRKIAYQLDFPEGIVEIRHEISHGRIPYIENLREASDAALLWLKNNYWETELQSFVDFVPDSIQSYREIIQDTLGEYQKKRYMELHTSTYSQCNRKRVKKDVFTSCVLKELALQAKKNKELFIVTIAQPEYLLSVTAANKPILTDDSFLEEETIDLPICMEEFWEPVIKVLCIRGLICDLIIALLKCHSESHPQNQRMAIAWIRKFLKSSVAPGADEDQEESVVCVILREYPQYLDWLCITTVCLKNPSKYVPAILDILVKHIDPPLSLETQHRLIGLVAIYIGSLAGVSSYKAAEDQQLYDVDHVKAVLMMHDAVKRGDTTVCDSENPWQLCDDDVNWESIPIGKVLDLDREMQVNALECTEDAFTMQGEKRKPEQSTEVSMEFDTLAINEDYEEYFNIKSFEENAAMEDFSVSEDHSNIICKAADIIIF